MAAADFPNPPLSIPPQHTHTHAHAHKPAAAPKYFFYTTVGAPENIRWPYLIDLCRALQCRKRELLRVILQVTVTPGKCVEFVTDPDLGREGEEKKRGCGGRQKRNKQVTM